MAFFLAIFVSLPCLMAKGYAQILCVYPNHIPWTPVFHMYCMYTYIYICNPAVYRIYDFQIYSHYSTVSLTCPYSIYSKMITHNMKISLYTIYIYILYLPVRRSSLTMSLAKDQVLQGPLVYLGFIELSPFSPHVHRRQVFSTLVLFRRHCTHSLLVSEPQMTTENYIGSMLNLTWTPFETCWCMIGTHHFVNHLQIAAPNGPFQFAMKSH